MTPSHDYDIAIIGGGLAGLSLAVRLAHPRFAHLRVLLAEARHEYRRDRTWSYWTTPHPFAAAVTHAWDQWAVIAGPHRVVQNAPGLRYEAIQADALYDDALRQVRNAPWIDLRLGARTEAAEGNPVQIRLDGEPLTAALAFDTRPDPALGRHGLTQRFLGQEIVTETPAFDPATAILMDFEDDPAGVHFTYVLPWSARHALVEDTWFLPPGAQPPDHRAAIRRYLARRHAVTRYETGFEEAGALAMDPVFRPASRGARLLPLGTPAGAARPSTGYAFNAIQAQCDAVADALARGTPPAPLTRRPATIRTMDATLLAMLQRRPGIGPALFTGLFDRSPPAALVRFLDDRATARDLLAVALAMPIGPTIRAAARHMLGRGGAWQTAPG